ncbi:protein SMG5-like [Xenia sp. Carnegie-2017]|uniref:protein SMG5-like n=1 Tax=Xenia sp. Carnegie-2017 TaxID=2897299 RepID=UPI001F04D3C8|nr:protein SMG5-like [Xenia sp. Carnegie-2017]
MEEPGDSKEKNDEGSSENSNEAEKALRLFRSSVQVAQKIDSQIKSSSSWQELFSSDVILRRQRLRDSCELLLFSYPEDYGRKSEELLWRKVCYDIIQKLKYFRKKSIDDADLLTVYRSHLRSAMTLYQHLLVKIQNISKINLRDFIDWLPTLQGLDHDVKGKHLRQSWVFSTCQRILIYLGDLARYQQELDGESSRDMAERFYHQAIFIGPDLGMPYNQLGTLFWDHRYGCRSAYYYLRCLMSGSPFEGTEGNLLRLFEENHKTLQQQQQALVAEMAESKVRLTASSRFLTQFLYLQEIFYKSINLTAEDLEKLTNFILQELDMSLNHTYEITNQLTKKTMAVDKKTSLKSSLNEESNGEHLMDTRTLVEMQALLVIMIERMKIKGSIQLPDAHSFFMKFLTEIIRHLFSNLETSKSTGSVVNQLNSNGFIKNGFTPLRDGNVCSDDNMVMKAKLLKKKLLTQRRRRRRHSTLSDSGSEESEDHEGVSSDLSEGELDDLLNEALSEDGSDFSSLSDDEYSDSKKIVNGEHSADSISPKSVPIRHHILTNVVKEDLLMVLKISLDWLRLNPEVVKCPNSAAMFSQLVSLLNILPKQEEIYRIGKSKDSILHDIIDENVDESWVQKYGIREDISLLGFSPLAKLHGRLDFFWCKNVKHRKLREVVIRLQSIKANSVYLASLENVTFVYDRKSDVYSTVKPTAVNGEVDKAHVKENERRTKLMKTMAKQRLQSEVADLENKVKSQSLSPSPFLIPDAPTICAQLHVLRQLVNTRNFVIVVPVQVIQALDELKKFNPGAREAIKYLEQELKKGNRWIRAQKESESTSTRSQKRGKQEEISIWRFNQVVNCCLYFMEQSGPGLVTLLTDDGDIETLKKKSGRGNAAIAVGTKATPQAVELALKNNINVQSIKSFRAQCTGKNSVT